MRACDQSRREEDVHDGRRPRPRVPLPPPSGGPIPRGRSSSGEPTSCLPWREHGGPLSPGGGRPFWSSARQGRGSPGWSLRRAFGSPSMVPWSWSDAACRTRQSPTSRSVRRWAVSSRTSAGSPPVTSWMLCATFWRPRHGAKARAERQRTRPELLRPSKPWSRCCGRRPPTVRSSWLSRICTGPRHRPWTSSAGS